MTPDDGTQGSTALPRAMAMVADLRDRCAWDRVQTRETLRPYLIEEAHELAAALGSGDQTAIREEVADLMLHLAWQLVLGEELGEFTPDLIADDLVAKMQRRHPHLFALGPSAPWEALKAREPHRHGGRLDGLPTTLPTLLMARRMQERAAGVGFDWPDTAGPLAKVHEELAETEAELPANGVAPSTRLTEEIGDLLFAVVNLARKAGVDPDQALELSNRKFHRRFQAVEAGARAAGLVLGEASLAELDAIWDAIKREESASPPVSAEAPPLR